MKHPILLFSLILGMTALSFAGSTEPKFKNELTVQAGILSFEGDAAIKNPILWGLRYGRFVAPRWMIEGSLLSGRSDFKQTSTQADFLIPSVHALYHFGSGKLTSYLGAGLGMLKIMPDQTGAQTDLALQVQAGIKYYFIPSLLGRVEAAYLNDGSNGTGTHNLLVTGGLAWAFDSPFGCPSNPAPLVKDEDADGVSDDKDACPRTPRDVKVDEKGCPLDTDKDGVPDYLDKCPGTPKGTKVDAQGCAAEVSKKVPMPEWTISEVEFPFNSDHIDARSERKLQHVMDVLNSSPTITIEIDGHTDNRGPRSYNQILSLKRAEAAQKYLIKLGMSADRSIIKGWADTQPVATNHSIEGRAKNRRVEFQVILP